MITSLVSFISVSPFCLLFYVSVTQIFDGNKRFRNKKERRHDLKQTCLTTFRYSDHDVR